MSILVINQPKSPCSPLPTRIPLITAQHLQYPCKSIILLVTHVNLLCLENRHLEITLKANFFKFNFIDHWLCISGRIRLAAICDKQPEWYYYDSKCMLWMTPFQTNFMDVREIAWFDSQRGIHCHVHLHCLKLAIFCHKVCIVCYGQQLCFYFDFKSRSNA